MPSGPATGGPTRVALVGAGTIAETHAAVLARTPDVELVAVCDPAEARARSLATRFRAPHVATRVADLAAFGVQIAHVLVPPALHVAVARELLELGIGVLVEKPVALSTADARALAELAGARGLPFGVNHNQLFHPQFQRLLADVRAGRIGRVDHVQVTLCVPLRQLDAGDFSHWMFREPGNIVFEQAPHPFSQLEALLGRVRSVDVTLLGTRELLPGQPFHDRWLLAARAERGTAEVLLSFGPPFPRSTLQVLGTDGSIQVDLHHGHFERETKTQWLDFWNSFLAGWRRGGLLRRSAAAGAFRWFAQTLGLAERADPFYAGMRGSIHDFHAAVRAGRRPRCDADQALAVPEWCERVVATLPARPPVEEPSFDPGPARPGEVCVLGGTGFIGRRVVSRLLAREVPLTVVVRRRTALPPELVEGSRDGRVRLFQASLGDAAGLRAAIEGARVVLHLATGGGPDWEAVKRSMVGGTEVLAEACLEAGVARLVYASSTAALYLGGDSRRRELDDSVGPDPRSDERAPYARGKAEAERLLMRMHRMRSLPVTVVRPAVVVGAGSPLQHSGLGLWVRDNHCVGWGRGDHPVPLVHVDDVADAFVRTVLFEGDALDGRALNLATRQRLGARAIVERYARATGRALVFHPRSLLLSQLLEVGKWVVKKVGRRPGAVFPSYRDLKSRALVPTLACPTARELLDWHPCEDGEEIVRRVTGAPRLAPGGTPEDAERPR